MALLAWLVLTLLPGVTHAAEPTVPRRVLGFYLYGNDSQPNIAFDKGLRTALQSATPVTIDYYAEYLEIDRFPSDRYSMLLRDYLRQKYEGRKIDVVIAETGVVLSFLLKHRDVLFPDAPIVYFAYSPLDLSAYDVGPGFTGVVVAGTYRSTLDIALRLHPETKEAVILIGGTPRDKSLELIVRDELKDLEKRVALTYLTSLPTDDLIARVKSATDGSIILYIEHSDHEPNKSLSPIETLGLIARSSKVPIYGIVNTYLGHGIVGGSVINLEDIGTQVAKIALRVLNGARPQDIAVENAALYPLFDWRQLRRWGIREDELPPGSDVRFEELTFWDRYKRHIIAVLAVILVQTLLIAFLILERARRQRATQQLGKSEEQFRLLFQNSKDAILISDDSGRYLQVNEAACEVLGYSCDQLLRMNVTDVVSADGLDTATRYQNYLEKGFESGEWSSVRPDGDRRTIQYTASRFAPGLHLSVVRDITDRKRAEDALRESEARYRQMFEQNRAVQLLIDPTSGAIVRANPAAAEFYGYSLEALERMKITDINTLNGDHGSGKMVTAATEQCSNFVLRHRLASGEVRDVDIYSSPLEVGGDRLIYSIIHDITERRRTEQQLRRFFDLPLVGMAITSPDRHFLLVNQKLCDMLGYQQRELTGKTWVEVTHPEDIAENVRLLEQTLRGETEGYGMDKRFFHRDGHVVYARISSRCVRRDDGSVDHLVLIIEDITERRQAEQSLRRAFRNIEQLKAQLQAENIYLEEEIKLNHNFDEIIGESKELKYVFHKVEQVALTDTTVLLLGETGTGKELVARAIHRASPRKDRPFITVNCATLPATLIESELFGFERGAFTGAHARKFGRFELANEGTVFLDEVGELPLELQTKLLRVLQEGEFERLGGSQTIKINVRIIAATNRNMKMDIQNGLFRGDLWYRLSVFPITLPPLRQRKEDIPLLVNHFVNLFGKKLGKELKSVAPITMKALQDYTWPGNIRELANVIERAVINAQGPVLLLAEKLDPSLTFDVPLFNHQSLAEMERDIILQRLEEANWKIEGTGGAAQSLGLKPSTLRLRMTKLGIQRSNSNH